MSSSNNNLPSSRYIKLQVHYGSDLYELFLSNKDHHIRVEHVLDEIAKLTKVPKCHQTVMHKGQRLDQKPKANLDDLYVFNNSKLILSGTPQQFHDQYCCPDHGHQIITTSRSKPMVTLSQSQQRNDVPIDVPEQKLTKDSNDSSITQTQISSTIPKKQDTYFNPIGFVPEPNKTYEYYTVPYKTDPTTLLQTIPLSASNVH